MANSKSNLRPVQRADGTWIGLDGQNYPFPPPIRHNRPRGRQPTTMGNQIMARGHQGFAGQMQGAMGQMMGMNLANRDAVQANRDRAAAQQRDFWQARVGMMNAMAPVQQEQIRAQALGQLLGIGGGQQQQRPTRYTSNIGQGINMQPQGRPRKGRWR